MRTLLALSFAAVFALTAVADEEPKGKEKGKGRASQMVTKLMSGLEEAGLSDEQLTQVKAAAVQFETSAKEIRTAGLTNEVNKAYMTAMKEARAAGAKGKELAAKAAEAISEEHAALIKKMREATTTMKKSVAASLTEEQMAALPEAIRKQLQTREGRKGAGKGKGKEKKGKKKKDDAESTDEA